MSRIAAVFGHRFASTVTRDMIFALQHGGEDGCGIAVPGKRPVRKIGLVSDAFPGISFEDLSPARRGIGYTWNATRGMKKSVENVAPFVRDASFGTFYLAFDGNIINHREIRDFLIRKGIGLNGTNHGELILKLIMWKAEQKKGDLMEAVRYAMRKMIGAFSVVMLGPDCLYAFRDRKGVRPLMLGKKKRTYFVASETCALDKCGARTIREIGAGEIARISRKGVESLKGVLSLDRKSCIFCPTYTAFPTSKVFGILVHEFRTRMGSRMGDNFKDQFQQLIERYGRENIVISPVPDTGTIATMGFARGLEAMDLYEEVIFRSRYAGRTFINITQAIRDYKVKMKFSFIKKLIKGKVIIIVDDSIVRGSVTRGIVRILKKLGAIAVYVVIYSPQIFGLCNLGVDTPTDGELVANRKEGIDGVADYLGADGLLHCTVDDQKSVVTDMGLDPGQFCYACFDGKYPYGDNSISAV